MLTITNLSFQYEKSPTVYHYNLKVHPNETVALLGRSGSGKSTLLDLIAGFLTPLSGSITLNGQELTTQSVETRPVSILFQNHNLFEHLSVEKNILLGVSNHLRTRQSDRERVLQILKEVGLEGDAQKPASALSGGQQQRVALARVLLRDKPILLLDEPFSGLDRTTRLEMLDLVKKITLEKHLQTIMVTHEIEDAKRIANQTYQMRDGALVKA